MSSALRSWASFSAFSSAVAPPISHEVAWRKLDYGSIKCSPPPHQPRGKVLQGHLRIWSICEVQLTLKNAILPDRSSDCRVIT
jgi:hypothetical protein